VRSGRLAGRYRSRHVQALIPDSTTSDQANCAPSPASGSSRALQLNGTWMKLAVDFANKNNYFGFFGQTAVRSSPRATASGRSRRSRERGWLRLGKDRRSSTALGSTMRAGSRQRLPAHSIRASRAGACARQIDYAEMQVASPASTATAREPARGRRTRVARVKGAS
jgi:hypothetical protein